jgi:MtN3 and saliva related transmembrane protein
MEIDDTLLNILGLAASILILSGWLEQIIKGYKTKSLTDISKYLMLLISGGAVLWLIYGLVISDIFITGTNIAAIFLMMTVFFMKKRYDNIAKIKNIRME